MHAERILGGLIRGALGVRRKRSRRAARFLTGGSRSFLTAGTLLTAAGLAWGAYETMRRKDSTSGGFVTSPPNDLAPHLPDGRSAQPLPIPGGMSESLARMIQLAVSAAHADGALSQEERAAILDHARAAGAADIVEREIAGPKPLTEIVAGAAPEIRSDLYTLAFTIVRADEDVSGAERIYLAQLAHALGLDAETTQRLESAASSRIDAEPI
ncbi:MAG: DUF533 domain-containing protein [Vicinamibacteria bacterium]|nr:DUF533 domain-containing protein [Vicinamibacteria bacterium]